MKKTFILLSYVSIFVMHAAHLSPIMMGLRDVGAVAWEVSKNLVGGTDPVTSLQGQPLVDVLTKAGVKFTYPQQWAITMSQPPLFILQVACLTDDAIRALQVGFFATAVCTGGFFGYQGGRFLGWVCRVGPKAKTGIACVGGMAGAAFMGATAIRALYEANK